MDASKAEHHPWFYSHTEKYLPTSKPTAPRMIQRYQPIKTPRTLYPTHGVSIIPSLDNLSACQNLFANSTNFACSSTCDVFEVDEDGRGTWNYCLGDEKLVAYLKVCHYIYSSFLPLTRLSQSFSLGQTRMPSQHLKLRAIFCTLRRYPGTSFGYQVSLTSPTAEELLTGLRASPHFFSLMLGEPDYWAPLYIPTRSDNGVSRAEAMWQHPRYNIHTRQQPCSVYMGYDFSEACTTYIIVSGENEGYVERTKGRLSDYFHPEGGLSATATEQINDPFLLQSILCHESLTDGKENMRKLRHRLYDQLDIVGEYAKEPFDKSNLKEMTNQLHLISQDVDSVLASTEMAGMISRHMAHVRQRMLDISPNTFRKSNIGEALVYLVDSIDAQKRWLHSLKSRKDIAMNLVFNLVTQQDSETSTSIARDTKDDSASMKIIAVMTMLFLPTTAVSGFFSMSFFTSPDPLQASTTIWLFAAVTFPLTVLIILGSKCSV
ncbi:predicted protein [Uncinocarpus reesii 1704]|uniref:Uncharacterized protein n=1 Tax=Uncinocarpus reesii (strain UAMH 1704) TaxID=336963 RepID=C4JYP5_UNCRE|nr:uncharacterized protein UREG_07296 [Uncinocarpus reesii 1704]EEP82431.1 predicted protein [Uncinocarpus reesii 1704]